MVPFFLNSNIAVNDESITSYSDLMKITAGNVGNSYITYSLLKELGIEKLLPEFHIPNVYHFDYSRTDEISEFINSHCTHVFFILQDQIRSSESYGLQLPYKNIEHLLLKINVPIVIAGLGANSFSGFTSEFYKCLNPELISFLKFLSERCVELGVRGTFTAEVLNQIGVKNVCAIGCPSYFEEGKDRIILKKNKISPDSIFFTSYYPNPLYNSNYQICQDDIEADIIKSIAFDTPVEIKEFMQAKRIFEKKYRFFPNIENWKEFAQNFNFSIGYRLHGCILSLNSGIVSVCCNGDSRAREMCELLKIPYMPELDPKTDLVNLYDEINIDDTNREYSSLYKNFNSFIHRNVGIDIFNKQETIVKPIQPSLTLYNSNLHTSLGALFSVYEANLDNEIEKITKHEKAIDELYVIDNSLTEKTVVHDKKIENHIKAIDDLYIITNDLILKLREASENIVSLKQENETLKDSIEELNALNLKKQYQLEQMTLKIDSLNPLLSFYRKLIKTRIFTNLKKVAHLLQLFRGNV